MRTALLLIGLIVSPISFAGEKQLTCLYIESVNPHSKGLMDKGAWRTDKIIFNTDDFDKSAPLLTLIVELKYYGKDKEKLIESTRSYNNLTYRVSPSSILFEDRHEFGTDKYKVDRTHLTIVGMGMDGECSIGDVEVLRNRVF